MTYDSVNQACTRLYEQILALRKELQELPYDAWEERHYICRRVEELLCILENLKNSAKD